MPWFQNCFSVIKPRKPRQFIKTNFYMLSVQIVKKLNQKFFPVNISNQKHMLC